MPTWPYQPALNPGLADNDPVSAAQLVQIDQNAAAGASGLIWSDMTLIRNWKGSSGDPATAVERALVYDAASNRWLYVGFNLSSAPVAYYTVSGLEWHATGAIGNSPAITSINQAASDGSGNVLVGVTCSGGSTGKLVWTDDGGLTWTRLFFGTSDAEGVETVVYNADLNLWIVSVGATSGSSGGIYSCDPSVNLGVWTQRSPSTGYGDLVSRNSPSPRILAMNAFGAGSITGYKYSDDGINWTPQTTPFNQSGMHSPCWNDYFGVFAVCAPNGGGIWTSPTGLTGSWTLVNDYVDSGLASYGRYIVRGDGRASIDGGVTWREILELGSSPWHPVAGEHGIAYSIANPGDSHATYLSLQSG